MSETKVIIKNVRFSYPHLFEPKAIVEGGVEKYSVSVIIPKDDTDTIEMIEAAVKAAFEAGKGKVFKGKLPSSWDSPLRDGDVDKADHPEYEDTYFINAKSTNKPGVIDIRGNKLEPEDLYAGCYGHVSINFYAYNKGGNKGVGAGLQNVCKNKEGERLSGGAAATTDFGDLLETVEDDL